MYSPFSYSFTSGKMSAAWPWFLEYFKLFLISNRLCFQWLVTPTSLSHHFTVIPLHIIPDSLISLTHVVHEEEDISHKWLAWNAWSSRGLLKDGNNRHILCQALCPWQLCCGSHSVWSTVVKFYSTFLDFYWLSLSGPNNKLTEHHPWKKSLKRNSDRPRLHRWVLSWTFNQFLHWKATLEALKS